MIEFFKQLNRQYNRPQETGIPSGHAICYHYEKRNSRLTVCISSSTQTKPGGESVDKTDTCVKNIFGKN